MEISDIQNELDFNAASLQQGCAETFNMTGWKVKGATWMKVYTQQPQYKLLNSGS